MSNKSIYLVVACILMIVAVAAFGIGQNSTVQEREPEVTLGPIITAVPTATPIPTQTPVTIVIVTLAPTATPTVTPTEVPTEVPTAVPTEVPTEVPTTVPTAVPTETPKVDDIEKKYATIETELSKITIMGGIYPDYNSMSMYDLYDYIDVNGLDDARLFKFVRKSFESGIVAWTDMSFNSGTAIDMLSFALNSTICEKCGRVKITEHPENLSQITSIFDEIERSGNQKTANRILLDYLYKYTKQNPDNSSERLIIACNDK